MNDTATHTIRVADVATTGQDRLDGPVLLDAIRDALTEYGAIRLSFGGVSCVTPTLVNEAMVPLLEDSTIETLRNQVMLVDVSRGIVETVRRCMENGASRNDGKLTTLADIDVTRLPVLDMVKDDDGCYQLAGDLHMPDEIPDHLNPFIRGRDLDDATIERMIEEERRPLDSDESAFDRMMRPTLRDLGITVIRCRDERRDMRDFDMVCGLDLPNRGFDHRAHNSAPRSYRRR